MPKNPRVFINGTDGQPNYLVIGKKGEYTIGLKPVLVPHPSALMCGMHIRVVWKNPEATLSDGALRKKNFPALKFSAIDDSRVSVVLGFTFKLPKFEPNKFAFYNAIESVICNKSNMLLLADGVLSQTSLPKAAAEHSVKDIADFIMERLSRELLNARVKDDLINKGFAEGVMKQLAGINLSPKNEEPPTEEA